MKRKFSGSSQLNGPTSRLSRQQRCLTTTYAALPYDETPTKPGTDGRNVRSKLASFLCTGTGRDQRACRRTRSTRRREEPSRGQVVRGHRPNTTASRQQSRPDRV